MVKDIELLVPRHELEILRRGRWLGRSSDRLIGPCWQPRPVICRARGGWRGRIRAGVIAGSAASWPSSASTSLPRASVGCSPARGWTRRRGAQARVGASSCAPRPRASPPAISSRSPDLDRVALREGPARQREPRPARAEADGVDAPAEQVERRVDLQHPRADVDGRRDDEEDRVADEVAPAGLGDDDERQDVRGEVAGDLGAAVLDSRRFPAATADAAVAEDDGETADEPEQEQPTAECLEPVGGEANGQDQEQRRKRAEESASSMIRSLAVAFARPTMPIASIVELPATSVAVRASGALIRVIRQRLLN